MVYIGIDLGTTYSCVSVIANENPVVMFSDDGLFLLVFEELICEFFTDKLFKNYIFS